MTDLSRLAAKLNRTCRSALERAAERCLAHTHYAVEIEHLFLELAQDPGSDLARALGAYQVDGDRLAAELQRALTGLPTGGSRTPGLSAHLATAFELAWLVASIDLRRGDIGSAALLRAVLDNGALRDQLARSAPVLAGVPRQRLADDLPGLVAAGGEGGQGAADTGALGAYTVDLTARARAGELDPVIGREAEIAQVIEILMRRSQNNPILTGEAGVGKTAIVEGLAQRIADGLAPAPLAGVALYVLDLGLLQAGASARGEFEQRLRTVVDAVSAAPAGAVLFIDEAHMLVGAGGAAGQADAANLLKPALARGGLRVVAATTWSEYKRHFEKDAALTRRFQVVKVDEPGPDSTIEILRRLSGRLEAFHGVRIAERALHDAVWLSQRYIAGRQLPEKAISVLDTACARVAIAQTSRPHALELVEARCAGLDAEMSRLADEPCLAREAQEKMERLREAWDAAEESRNQIESRWRLERDTVRRVRALETEIDGDPADPRQPELMSLRLQLQEIQQDAPLVPLDVDGRAVAEVVSGWTGVPVGAILGATIQTARVLADRLAERIVGQGAALDTIVRRVQTFFAGLGDPGKPTGVFLLCGPSGVGKTETALALADLLFGGPRALITVNMSEYQEAHTVSGLKGAPPGYVGYGKGGVLTEAVRRQPYSVLLLDEVEKAHTDVIELFYQIFDRGLLEDSEGVTVDFTNTLILLTSNVGAEVLTSLSERRPRPSADQLVAAIRPALLARFAPAFLGRLVVTPYCALGPPQIEAIVRLKLQRIQQRFEATRRTELTYDERVVSAIAEAAGHGDGGARTVDAIITQHILPQLSGQVLDSLARGEPVGGAHIMIDPQGGLQIEWRP